MNPRALITAFVLFVSVSLGSHAQTTNADVIVYGSTPGGFCAAIAAAREGASVILLEPTSHVGGMNTGGLSFSDSNQMYRDKLMGLFHEWHLRIQQDYQSRGITLPYDVNVKNQTTWSYEPHVAARVTNAMLAEAGVTVLTGRYLESVNKTGPRITEVLTKNGSFTGRVFIDGSYEGDLMAAAGVSWTIGREGRADFDESLAGKVYPKATMNINGFDGEGKPLPLITATDAGPVDDGDDNIMTYSFRLSLTTAAANKIPMPAPANYDPARFEVMRRYVQSGGGLIGYDRYTVPGNKVDGNNSISRQFSLGFIGGAKDWHTADEAGRAAIFEAHKQYTLEFIHFLSTDPVFTAAQRNNIAQWGLCADEFTDTNHWPPQLYVRESRRMQGMAFITENDIIANPSKPDPIMVSSFPIDSHDCQRVVLPDGRVVNEGTIYPVRPPGNNRGYPYHVPYRSILPQPAECDNLLVPVALSCSHVAISSLRIEATWMLIGQSAGIAAAMAADRDVAVQDLPYADLKPRLEAQGQILTLPDEFLPPEPLEGIVLDDPEAELTGTWGSSTNFKPYVGAGYRFTGAAGTPNDGSATATFRFTATEAGLYQLNMAYTPDPSRATNVPLTITSGEHVTNFSVDQTIVRPAGSVVREIGKVQLVAGQESVITLGTAGTTGFVILDAVQLILDTPGENDLTPPVPISMTPMGNHVPTTADLSLTFNEPVQKGSGEIRLFRANGTPVETVAVTHPSVTINSAVVTIPIADLAAGTGYYVNIDGGAFADLAGNAFGGIAGSTAWSFTTVPPPPPKIIYSDDFSGLSTDNLHGTTPDTTLGTTTWVAHPNWKADGSIAQVGGNATDHNAFLPFAPEAGRIYTLSATLSQPTGTTAAMWAAIGFTNDTLGTAAGNNGQSFWAGSNAASPWMLYRSTAVSSSTISTFTGPGTTGALTTSNYTGTQTMTIVLDTTAAQWTAEWFVGGTPVRGPLAFETNPSITHVGLGREDGGGADFSNFVLSVEGGDITFAEWIAGFAGLNGQTELDDDPDGDGISNGVEAWFGTHPGEFNAGLTGVTSDGNAITFEHPRNDNPPSDLNGFYEWSPNLADWYAGDGVSGPPSGPTVTITPATSGKTTTVTATTSEPVERLFLRVGVVWR